MSDIKGVIVAAGYGSRFLPATKTVPKEMLPLIDRPAIAFIVDEFLRAGIRDILVISSRRKKVLEDYFDREIELESVFQREGKSEKLKTIAPTKANFFFVRQQDMRGTGHALLQARPFTGGAPFVVAYPDDLFPDGNLSSQLVATYRATGFSVLSAQDLAGSDVSRYGVVEPYEKHGHTMAKRLVEKPAKGTEPSTLVSYGRYLFTKDLWQPLEAGWQKHHHGEYYHIGALNALGEAGKLAAHVHKGLRLDTGEPMGYLEAVCRYALTRPEWREDAQRLFKELAGRT